jgi:hypothetical protein
MAIKRRHEVAVFSMSFIDCICCGFGAMILLLVLSQSKPPPISVPVVQEDRGGAADLSLLGEQTAGEKKALEEALAASRDRQRDAEQELVRLRVMADSLENKTTDSTIDRTASDTIEKQLAAARQTLTEEMRRLQAQGVRVRNNAPVGGIPVDSEYIIFVIDTSGSMQAYAWKSATQMLSETLDLYPKVKGMQVMDDQGGYMFSEYRGKWIPDTPGRRRVVIERMRSWQPFSNSNPVEGIEAAIRAFYAPDKKISIYVFGDDFTGGSVDTVRKTVRRLNPKDARGNPRVRIHAVGFPTQYGRGGVSATGVRFANLMRILCQENGGSFVGLPSAS